MNIGEVNLKEILVLVERIEDKTRAVDQTFPTFAEISLSWANVREENELVFQVRFAEHSDLVSFVWKQDRWRMEQEEKFENFLKIIKRIKESEENIKFLEEIMYKV